MRATRQTPGPAAPGFTLVELMIVVAIVGLLGAMVVPAVESVSGADARKAAGELAGAMRYMFDTAALRHATCRLALDLDKRAWRAECAPGAATVAADPAREKEDAARLAERFPDEQDPEVRRLLARTTFGRFEDRLVKERALPGKTGFGPVHVEGRRGAIEEGTAYVYFFPGGQAQRAWVSVVDGSNRYTVVVEPFTGRARVVPGLVEVRE
jgi:general secretion pathway protein H